MPTESPILHVGEVIQSNSSSLVAQCPRPRSDIPAFPKPPPLGSFVAIPTKSRDILADTALTEAEEPDPFAANNIPALVEPDVVFGIVSLVETSSLDPGRRATALGIETEEELRRIQPQVFELLTMEFNVLLTSCSDGSGRLLHRLPPRPPRVHAFIYPCSPSQLMTLTEDFGCLRSLLSVGQAAPLAGVDDLAAAAIIFGWEARAWDDRYLVRAGKAVLKYALDDYDRFQSILQRVTIARP